MQPQANGNDLLRIFVRGGLTFAGRKSKEVLQYNKPPVVFRLASFMYSRATADGGKGGLKRVAGKQGMDIIRPPQIDEQQQ